MFKIFLNFHLLIAGILYFAIKSFYSFFQLPFYGHNAENVENFLAKSLKDLRTDYIDLYLMHTPIPMKVCRLSGELRTLKTLMNIILKRLRIYEFVILWFFKFQGTAKGEPVKDADGKFIPELIPLIDTWRLLEKHYKAGVLKSIGVSNFNAQQLSDLYEKAEIKPHNLQVGDFTLV